MTSGRTDSSLAGRTVLVTGGMGFIGRQLTSALVRLGSDVHAVSRSTPESGGKRVTWWKGDLADLNVARGIVGQARPEIVIHLAAYAWGTKDLSAVAPTFYGCLATTINVLTTAAETGCRKIVLPGSFEEPEGLDSKPSSPYSAAKWACSVYGRMFRNLTEMDVVQTRIFMAYGPGQDDRKVIPYTILSLLDGRSPVLRSRGRLVDWIHIEDVVEGLLAASRLYRLEGQVMDIGSGVGTHIEIVAEKLRGLIRPECPIRYDDMTKRIEEVVRVADVEATYQNTGWRPRIPLEDGLRNTLAWYTERYREKKKGAIQ